MPAITFFALLDEGYRLKAQDYLMLYNISILPYVDKESRSKLLKQLEWAATDPSDILKQSDDYSGIDKLKGIL